MEQVLWDGVTCGLSAGYVGAQVAWALEQDASSVGVALLGVTPHSPGGVLELFLNLWAESDLGYSFLKRVVSLGAVLKGKSDIE